MLLLPKLLSCLSRRGLWHIVGLTAVALSSCRDRNQPAPHARNTPTCAVQDCVTGRILDDGCSSDGRCVSCVNECPVTTGGAGQDALTVPPPVRRAERF